MGFTLEEIAEEIERASLSLNAAHKAFVQLYQEKKDLTESESKAWNAVVKACDAIGEAAEFVESHGYIVA